jgi:hypothetical protein
MSQTLKQNSVKLFFVVLLAIIYSCKVSKENITPQTATNNSKNKAARKSPITNTVALMEIKSENGKQPHIVVSFSAEKGIKENGLKRNFVLDQTGTILKELYQADNLPTGTPIRGVSVKGGKNPGGQLKEMKTDENGEVVLPEEWVDGEYLIQIESKTQSSTFMLSIGKEKIKDVDAPNMLINNDGSIRNFYYEADFKLHSDISKYFDVDEIIIEKGYYPVDYSKKGSTNGGSVILRGKTKGKVVKSDGHKQFEGTNPKGIDCKGFGVACFYNAETGIDKNDKLFYDLKPIFEKETFIGFELSEVTKGLIGIDMRKALLDDLNGLIR